MKQQIERTWGERFLKLYNLEHSSSFNIINQPNPPEPDLKCEDVASAEVFYLEVTELWEDNEDAKDYYDLVNGRISEKEQFRKKLDGSARKNPLEIYYDRLVNRIAVKCDRRYSVSDRIFLIIADQSRLCHEDRIRREVVSRINVAHKGPFDEIRLLLCKQWPGEGYSLLKIA